MKLALKLPLAFAATLLFVVAAALFGIYSLNRAVHTFETDVHVSHERAAAASPPSSSPSATPPAPASVATPSPASKSPPPPSASSPMAPPPSRA